MPIKSQTTLYSIIIISLLIFISAIVWKFSRHDNSEPINITPVKVIEKNIVNRGSGNKTINDSKINNNVIKTEQNEIIEDEYSEEDKSIEKLNSTLNLNLMFKTPESLINAIEHYESIGENSKAQKYIDFLREKFPDYDY